MPQVIDTQIYCEVTTISGERQIKHNITRCHAWQKHNKQSARRSQIFVSI